MSGRGLADVRAALTAKDPLNAHQFVPPHSVATLPMLHAIATGMTLIEAGWTDGQRDAIRARLTGAPVDKIAANMKVSIRAIHKQLKSAHAIRYPTPSHGHQGRALDLGLPAITR